MDISFHLMKLTGLAIDTLSKLSRATIRVHDAERIPKAPVVFVINHFTRMETFFLPNVIYKITGKYLYSLAHYSFFYRQLWKIHGKGWCCFNERSHERC